MWTFLKKRVPYAFILLIFVSVVFGVFSYCFQQAWNYAVAPVIEGVGRLDFLRSCVLVLLITSFTIRGSIRG